MANIGQIAGMDRLSISAKFVYWTLLLEPIEEASYKRVGIAILYPHGFEALDAWPAEFEII
jgi:hypothetical protein